MSTEDQSAASRDANRLPRFVAMRRIKFNSLAWSCSREHPKLKRWRRRGQAKFIDRATEQTILLWPLENEFSTKEDIIRRVKLRMGTYYSTIWISIMMFLIQMVIELLWERFSQTRIKT